MTAAGWIWENFKIETGKNGSLKQPESPKDRGLSANSRQAPEMYTQDFDDPAIFLLSYF